MCPRPAGVDVFSRPSLLSPSSLSLSLSHASLYCVRMYLCYFCSVWLGASLSAAGILALPSSRPHFSRAPERALTAIGTLRIYVFQRYVSVGDGSLLCDCAWRPLHRVTQPREQQTAETRTQRSQRHVVLETNRRHDDIPEPKPQTFKVWRVFAAATGVEARFFSF